MYTKDDFQLVAARTAYVKVDMPWRRERDYINPNATFRHRAKSSENIQRDYITAIIGRNGTGKSHLLSAIVRTFIAIEDFQVGKKSNFKGLPLEYLEYISDGKRCIISQENLEHSIVSINDKVSSVLSLPLPRHLVALTISPFDKFPVPRALLNRAQATKPSSSMYQYLGLRDGFGKASIETLLYRSLNALFERSQNEDLRRSNIGAVFSFLHLKPTINVIYKLRDTVRLRNAVNRRLHLADDDVLSPSQQRGIEDVERSGVEVGELRALLEIAYQRAVGGRIETRADFDEGGNLDELFHKLKPLRRAGLMNLSGVEVTHNSGISSDLRSASSGTLSMVSALIALASVIEHGSLVLIDEPELSLHPEWQVKYIDLLIKTFEQYHGCHFVLATHSPMVISELPDRAEVISLDREDLPSTTALRGQSSDFLLAEAFGLPTNGNLYVKNQIVEALRLVASGKSKSERFEAVLGELKNFATKLSDEDPAKTIIRNLSEVAQNAGRKSEK